MMLIINPALLELDLTTKELTVLLHIAKSANSKNEACPSVVMLAKDANIGRDSVFKAIDGLVRKGLISKYQDRFNLNVYTINTNYVY